MTTYTQEPVGYQYKDRDGNWCNFMNEKHLADTRADGSWPIRAIYTHPAPMSKEDMVKVLEASYLLGFQASGEGYNFEYPFSDHVIDPENDADWCSQRREAITIMQSAIEGMK